MKKHPKEVFVKKTITVPQSLLFKFNQSPKTISSTFSETVQKALEIFL